MVITLQSRLVGLETTSRASSVTLGYGIDTYCSLFEASTPPTELLSPVEFDRLAKPEKHKDKR